MEFLGVCRQWFPEFGFKPVLAWGARKKVHLVYFDGAGIRKLSLPKREIVGMRELNYPVKRCVRHFKRIGRERGITKGAKNLMAQI